MLELLRPLEPLMHEGLMEKMRAAIVEAAKGGGKMLEGVIAELEDEMPIWYHRLIERGRAAMLLQLAECKFGPEAAKRLAGVATASADPVSADPADLSRLGEWIIDCDTLEELLARVENGAG